MSAAPTAGRARETPASRFPGAEFREAMEAGDADKAIEHWTDDCVLRPLGTDAIRFEGKARTRACLEAVFGGRDAFHYTEELHDDDTIAIFFSGHVSGLSFEAIDILRINEDGRCTEMFVLGRPYMPQSVFTGRVALAFARQGGNLVHRVLLNLLVWPLELTQRASDPLRARILRGSMERGLAKTRGSEPR